MNFKAFAITNMYREFGAADRSASPSADAESVLLPSDPNGADLRASHLVKEDADLRRAVNDERVARYLRTWMHR